MEEPVKPDDSDCCNSGCHPCIFDVYEEQLKRYRNLMGKSSEIKADYKNCISSTSYTRFILCNIKKHTNDTFFYTFMYANSNKQTDNELKLQYSPGQHFLLKHTSDSNHKDQFTRAYTPIPIDNDDVSFTILVRLYKNGKMSKFLNNIKINTETLWRGPYGDYMLDLTHEHMLLIAQGTGIAPIFSVIHALLQNDECYTFIKLFFCCRNENDILLREELYRLSSHWNFTYEVFLASGESTNAKYNETVHSQRLEKDKINAYLIGKQDSDLRVLLCGSDAFVSYIKDIILQCELSDTKIYVF